MANMKAPKCPVKLKGGPLDGETMLLKQQLCSLGFPMNKITLRWRVRRSAVAPESNEPVQEDIPDQITTYALHYKYMEYQNAHVFQAQQELFSEPAQDDD